MAAPAVQGTPAEKSETPTTYADRPEQKARTGGWKGNRWARAWNWGWSPSSKAPTVPADFKVDPEARYTGTVTFYNKWKGYGFIELKEKGVVPKDAIFAQWRNLQSSDRFPFLVKDLEVEFGLTTWKEQGGLTLRAKTVTLPGGGLIAVQNEVDREKKAFVGGQDLRYLGKLKFYNPRVGYGYISIEPGYQLEDGVPQDIRVERSEVNAGGKQPQWTVDTQVEFGIWKTAKGAYKAYNVTLPGGIPLTLPALEHRQELGGTEYTGTVTIWNWRRRYGFIKAAEGSAIPADVQAKLAEQAETAKQKAEGKGKTSGGEPLVYFRGMDIRQGVRLAKDQEVHFKLYTDDKGAGATEIY
jgi:cold shock CspA family protein